MYNKYEADSIIFEFLKFECRTTRDVFMIAIRFDEDLGDIDYR